VDSTEAAIELDPRLAMAPGIAALVTGGFGPGSRPTIAMMRDGVSFVLVYWSSS